MYIVGNVGYYTESGEQRCRRADFLLLWSPDCGKTIWGFIRKVAMRQCGHWMMGTARVEGRSITVSGSYGADGLTIGPEKMPCPKDARQLPAELVEAWNKGGGWNGAGNEALAMKKWARETFK